MPRFWLKSEIFHLKKNPQFWLFSEVLEVKLKFQDKFYNVIDYNKCPSSEKEDEKCIFGKSYFHQIQPNYTLYTLLIRNICPRPFSVVIALRMQCEEKCNDCHHGHWRFCKWNDQSRTLTTLFMYCLHLISTHSTCAYYIYKCASPTWLPRCSRGETINLLRARHVGGGQAGGLPTPHHQPAAEHPQDQPEQEEDHQDAPCHHSRLHCLLVSEVQQYFYRRYFFTKSFRYFSQILSNIFCIQVPDSHDWVVGADPGLGVQCHPTFLLLLTRCQAPSRHTRHAQSYYLQVTWVNSCRQYWQYNCNSTRCPAWCPAPCAGSSLVPGYKQDRFQSAPTGTGAARLAAPWWPTAALTPPPTTSRQCVTQPPSPGHQSPSKPAEIVPCFVFQ